MGVVASAAPFAWAGYLEPRAENDDLQSWYVAAVIYLYLDDIWR